MNELHDALRRTAESAPLEAADLGVIRARARTIRRRRAVVAVGGSIAAVAVIAGVGLTLAPHGADHAVPPIASTPAVPTPTETSQKPEVGQVFHVSTRVTDVSQTDPSAERVPYWRDGQLVAPDGTTTPLADRPDAVALDTQGDWWVIRETDAGTQLVQLSPDGQVKEATDAEGQVLAPAESVPHGMAAAPGREADIIKRPDGWVLTLGDMSIHLPRVTDNARVDGFLPGGKVAFTADGTHEQVADPAQGTIEPLAGTSLVRATLTGLTGLLAEANDHGTWTVQGADGSHPWSADWAGVGGFSPSGKYVALVGDPQHLVPGSQDWDADGATGTLWIRGAIDGSPVAVFTAPRGGFFGPWTWEGDDILTLVFERDSTTSTTGTWSLARLSADGYKMIRSASWPGRIDAPPYLFGAAVTPAA